MFINFWVKGEVYSLEALQMCANEIVNTDTLKRKAAADVIETQQTIDKLNSGKFTFGSMLKNEAEKKQSAIEKTALKAQLQLDVINYDIIKKMLIIYCALIAIPQFKKKSTQRYIIAMGSMCDAEVHNANSISDCWHSFKQLIDSHRIK